MLIFKLVCVCVCVCVCVYMKENSGPGERSRYSDLIRLDGSGIESRWGREFRHPSRPALGPTQLPFQWVPGTFFVGKAAGA